MNQIYNVTQLNNHSKSLIEANFNNVWVKGEISSIKLYDSNHLYLTIKDSQSELSCVGFNYKGNLSFEKGNLVTIFGNLTIYSQKGKFQLIVSDIYPVGDGALWDEYNQLKKKLSKEGLFDDVNKKVLPKYPKNIGIISSMNGSAIKDIIKIIHNKNNSIHLIIRNCLTQGINAINDIVDALDDFNMYNKIDLLIIARGGGSMEDLMCFNDEKVIRKIFKSNIPVVSAIGHQTDFTLTDLVSDFRASTPSDAANICVINKKDIVNNIDKNIELLYNKVINKLNYKQNQYIKIKNMIPANPLDILKNKYKNIVLANNLIKSNIMSLIDKYRITIKSHLKVLNSLDPKAIMKKGYSIVRYKKKIIKDLNDISIKDEVDVQFYKGSFAAVVKNKKEA